MLFLRNGQYLHDRYNCNLRVVYCALEYTITHVLVCCTEQIVLEKKQNLNGFSLRLYRTSKNENRVFRSFCCFCFVLFLFLFLIFGFVDFFFFFFFFVVVVFLFVCFLFCFLLLLFCVFFFFFLCVYFFCSRQRDSFELYSPMLQTVYEKYHHDIMQHSQYRNQLFCFCECYTNKHHVIIDSGDKNAIN